jgi:H+/Cl- antiporter ClcA
MKSIIFWDITPFQRNICSSEASVDSQRTTWLYISEDRTLHERYIITNIHVYALSLQEALGGNVFIIFTILLALFVLFVYKKVPETKNKTIEEISSMFRQISYQ